MKYTLLNIVTILSFLLIACGGPKSLTNKGNKLAEAGMHKEASQLFINALRKNPNYVDAKIGLRRSGQKVVDEKQSEFFRAKNNDEYKTAVYAYEEIASFNKTVKSVGVELSVPSYLADDYEAVKSDYLDIEFEEANELLAKEDFAGAEKIFNEIIRIQPDYKDVASLREFAKIEPLYRKGVAAMEKEKYRTAFRNFEKVVNEKPDYKDSKDRMKESLELAQYTIAFLPFENVSSEPSASDQISAKVLNDVLKNKGPFLRVIDRQNIDLLIKEQKLGMSGVVNESTAASAGNLIGAKAVLTGKVIDVKIVNQNPTSTRKKGYEAYQVRTYNKQTATYTTATKYKKVYYTEYQGKREVTCTFQYKLISSETGEILLTDLMTRSAATSVHYVSYKGNIKGLRSGNWSSQSRNSSNDDVHTSYESKQRMNRLINGNKSLRSLADLKTDVFSTIGTNAARAIYNFDPES